MYIMYSLIYRSLEIASYSLYPYTSQILNDIKYI